MTQQLLCRTFVHVLYWYEWYYALLKLNIFSRQLHSDRDPIPDVPAVYFCMPTEENLGRIGQDLQNGLYDAYHLNFISPISRQRLEDLAAAALHANCVSRIQKVCSLFLCTYIKFFSLKDNTITVSPYFF